MLRSCVWKVKTGQSYTIKQSIIFKWFQKTQHLLKNNLESKSLFLFKNAKNANNGFSKFSVTVKLKITGLIHIPLNWFAPVFIIYYVHVCKTKLVCISGTSPQLLAHVVICQAWSGTGINYKYVMLCMIFYARTFRVF